MKKRVRRGLCSCLFLSRRTVILSVVRESAAPATVSRPERSDRVSEEAQYHRPVIILLTPRSRIFSLPNRAVHTQITAVLT